MDLWTTPQDHAPLSSAPQAEVRRVEKRPDNIPEIDLNNPVFILKKKVSWNVGGIIHVADKGVVVKATAEKSGELRSETEKREFLQKLYLSTKDPVIKRSIENRMIQIYNIPGRALYAISLEGKNIDSLYEKNGGEYFDISGFRKKEIIGEMIEWLLERRFHIQSKNIAWTFQYSQNGKSIGSFDGDFLTKFAECVDRVVEFREATIKEAKKRREMEANK